MSTSQLEEEQSRLAIESANLGLWEWDLISGEISFDERCYEILGLPSQTKAQYPDVMKVVHFADRPAVEAAFKRALDVQGNGQFNMEYRIVQPGGRQRWVATLGAVQFGGAGAERRATCYAGMIQDITRGKQNNLIVAREKEALQLIAQSAPLADVLELLTRTIEELSGGGLLSSILLLDPDGLHLRHGAAPSLPVSYTRAIDGLTIGPTVGSCGTAAYRGQTVVVKDIARDPLWADYRDLALSHGLRACWSRPILSAGGKVLGTFAVYYGASRDPTPEDLELVELLTHTAAVAIERVRSEEIVKTKTVRRDLLSEALEHLLSSQESDPVLRELFFKVARQMELDTYFNYAVDPDGGALTLRSYEGIPEETAEKIQRLEFGEAICGTVAQTLQPIIATDIQHSDEDKTALARSFGIQAFACYPLMSGARLLGTLAFASRTRLRFDDEELEFIRIISRYAAVAMERADIEQRLRESEAYFREMAQDLPIVVWIRLPNGNLDFVNNVWLDYTGQSLDYLRSSPDAWTAALHADDLERVKGIYTEGLRSGASYTMEARFRRASDGAYRWHLIRCVPLRDPVGKVVKFIGTSTDIEDMKRAEVALRASEEEFRALFERAGVGKSQVDCKTKRFLRVNPKLCDLLGYSAEDLCTLTVLDITHPDDREMTNALFEKLNRGEITEASLEKRYVQGWSHRLGSCSGHRRQ